MRIGLSCMQGLGVASVPSLCLVSGGAGEKGSLWC